jgi:hypothetical protein
MRGSCHSPEIAPRLVRTACLIGIQHLRFDQANQKQHRTSDHTSFALLQPYCQ